MKVVRISEVQHYEAAKAAHERALEIHEDELARVRATNEAIEANHERIVDEAATTHSAEAKRVTAEHAANMKARDAAHDVLMEEHRAQLDRHSRLVEELKGAHQAETERETAFHEERVAELTKANELQAALYAKHKEAHAQYTATRAEVIRHRAEARSLVEKSKVLFLKVPPEAIEPIEPIPFEMPDLVLPPELVLPDPPSEPEKSEPPKKSSVPGKPSIPKPTFVEEPTRTLEDLPEPPSYTVTEVVENEDGEPWTIVETQFGEARAMPGSFILRNDETGDAHIVVASDLSSQYKEC